MMYVPTYAVLRMNTFHSFRKLLNCKGLFNQILMQSVISSEIFNTNRVIIINPEWFRTNWPTGTEASSANMQTRNQIGLGFNMKSSSGLQSICFQAILQSQRSKNQNDPEFVKDNNEPEDDQNTKGKKSGKTGSTLDSWVKKPENETKGRGKRSRKDDESNGEVSSKKSKASTPVEDSMADIDFDACDQKTSDGKKWNFKISSWNVAGIRAWAKKGGANYIHKEKPDILTLQETKCPESKLPPEVKVSGYHTYWLGSDKDGYAGVALYSKVKPIEIKYGIGDKSLDKEGRLITVEYDKFFLVATYVVNAGQGLKTLDRKLEWNKLFEEHLKNLDAKKPVILTGDLNVAHQEIDLKNPKTNHKSAGFTTEERADMTKLLSQGFVDTFRHLNPEKEGAYTFWNYIGNCRARNTGWRLDYFVVSERLLPSVCDSVIRDKVLGSDHCPVTLFLHL